MTKRKTWRPDKPLLYSIAGSISALPPNLFVVAALRGVYPLTALDRTRAVHHAVRSCRRLLDIALQDPAERQPGNADVPLVQRQASASGSR